MRTLECKVPTSIDNEIIHDLINDILKISIVNTVHVHEDNICVTFNKDVTDSRITIYKDYIETMFYIRARPNIDILDLISNEVNSSIIYMSDIENKECIWM